MNCLKLLHEYNAKISAIEQNQSKSEWNERLEKVIKIFENRHGGVPSWEEVENCKHE